MAILLFKNVNKKFISILCCCSKKKHKFGCGWEFAVDLIKGEDPYSNEGKQKDLLL